MRVANSKHTFRGRPLLLVDRRLDSGMHTLCVPCMPLSKSLRQSEQNFIKRKGGLGFASAATVADRAPEVVQDLARPARVDGHGAACRGRYGIEAESHAAPQADPRSRRKMLVCGQRSRESGFFS